jgi:GT2 family glycosyltransferase
MPARVHAVIVVRPDGRTPAGLHLARTLTALREQTRAVDHLSIVACGIDADGEISHMIADASPDTLLTLPGTTGFAAALERATQDVSADALWLLTQDTAPEPAALGLLLEALERSPSVAFAAPKLVRWNDRSVMVSMGTTMTRFGRTVDLVAGQLDQGQHDGSDDVLGADVRGILVRSDAWRQLGGLDAALLGADQGLDLGVRSWLAGARVTVVPLARVATAGDGVAGLPAPLSAPRRQRAALMTRAAQLHRRVVYAPLAAAPLLWLSILPVALARTVLLLFRKQPSLIGPEWGASFLAWGRPFAIIRARRRLSSMKRVPWSQLTPLRVSNAQLRSSFGIDEHMESPGGTVRTELRFFSGGAPWLVLATLAASVAAFPALLAWPSLGGGALQPLRTTVERLWADARYGQRSIGWNEIAPADPFSSLVALLGSATPWNPSQALVVLWILALPLAALGGWFISTRVTERPLLRLTGGIIWAFAPTFLIALVQGRPAAVILHLMLPWLFYAGAVAHRSWAGAGAASILLVFVVASAPSLAPALLVLWLVMLGLAVFQRGGRGGAKLVWLLVPTAVFFAPLIWHAIAIGDAWVLVADPGVVWAGPQVGADAAGRSLLAAGIPTSDIAGWTSLLVAGAAWWVPLLSVPLALLAIAAPLTQRWASGIMLLVVTALGLATAFASVGVAIAFTQSIVVPLWPGSAISLAWLGALGGALVALDAGLAPRVGALRAVAATVLAAFVVVLAIPSLTAMGRGEAFLDRGDASTLPAYVAAEGRGNPDVGTMVLTPQNEGGVAATFVWGGSETLGGQSTVVNTRTEGTEQDAVTGSLAADLITSADDSPVLDLAAHGVSFVLLEAPVGDEAPEARTMRLEAAVALNQRDTLEAVGETAKGELWRVSAEVAERPAESELTEVIAGIITASQVAVLAIALLLAVPTPATRREARRVSRVVGPSWQEGR